MPPPPPDAKPGGPFALSAPGVLAGKFEEAGMAVGNKGEVDCPMRYENFDEKWQMSISAGPLQNMKNVIGEEKLKGAIRSGCKNFTTKDGSIQIAPNVFIYIVAKP